MCVLSIKVPIRKSLETCFMILVDGETYIQGRDFFLSHIFFLEPGMPKLAPPCKQYRQRRPNASDRLRIPGSTLDSDWTLNLTTWFSYHVVSFRLHTCSTGISRRTAIHLFTNHNLTGCQSTRGHQEWSPNPCQLSLSNTMMILIPQQISVCVSLSCLSLCPVNRGCRIHRLHPAVE